MIDNSWIDWLNTQYYNLLYSWIVLALLVLVILLTIKTAQYGKFAPSKGKWQLDNKWGWFIMEFPALILLPLYFIFGKNPLTLPSIIFLLLYSGHYVYRTLLYPFLIKTKGKKIPINIVISAFIFNLFNTFFIGYYFGFIKVVELSALLTFHFFVGILIFFVGMVIHINSDKILIRLRKQGDTVTYQIPYGGLFNYLSSPNYFGEMVQWIGYALLTLSMPGLAFALWTIANLLPRALQTHRWYQQKFTDYPTNRKAVFPDILQFFDGH